MDYSKKIDELIAVRQETALIIRYLPKNKLTRQTGWGKLYMSLIFPVKRNDGKILK